MSKLIQESVIRDIVEVIGDFKDYDNFEALINRSRGSRRYGSIARASSKLTLVFPVIVSRSTSIEASTMIAKAIERKAVSMLQMLFTAMSITDARDAFEYIERYHTNLKMDDKMTVDDAIDILNKYVDEASMSDVDYRDNLKRILNELKQVTYPPNDINPVSLNSYKVKRNPYTNDTYVEQVELFNENAIGLGRGVRIAKDLSETLKNGANLNNMLMDNDVKKANELVPTLMNVTVNVCNGNGAVPLQFVLGVKAKIYPIDSTDILNRIVNKSQDTNILFNFIRATTGEIAFWKDFVFAIDKAKIDALSTSRRGSSSKMWKVLERRALKSKIKRGLNLNNDAPAIATLVITSEEADYLNKTEGIDINNPKVARVMMAEYNLLSVVVVNESIEVANFIFDTGDDVYEQLAFSSLEKEASDNSYKKVVKLLTKVNN